MKITNNTFENITQHNNKPNKFEDIYAECEKCLSEFVIESENDIKELEGTYGWSGILSVTCPCCGERTSVDYSMELNKNNVEYPKHFKMENGVTPRHVEDSEVQDEVRNLIKKLDDPLNDESDYTCSFFGDLFVFVMKVDEDNGYYVVVTRDYDNCFVYSERV